MEKVFCKCVIGHIFCHKQPLITLAAAAKQINQSMVAELTNQPCLLLQLYKGRLYHNGGHKWNREDRKCLISLNRADKIIVFQLCLTGSTMKKENIKLKDVTTNCRASGQATLLKRLTAILIWFSNFPL